MNQSINFPGQIRYGKEQEIYSRLQDLIHEYDGEVSLVAVIGILELIKNNIQESSK